MSQLDRAIRTLSLLTLFSGLATAQYNEYGHLVCSATVRTIPILRAEGFAEKTADIVVTCTGGTLIQPGGQVPMLTAIVTYNAPVTSRLFPVAGSQAGQGLSEALLLIDEPGSGLPGYGPSLPQALCTSPLTYCAAYVGSVPGPTYNTAVSSGTTPAPNVYQGIVSGNTVGFWNYPSVGTTAPATRVFRITNVRVNPQQLTPSTDPAAVVASITINGGTTYSEIANIPITVGYIFSNGLSADAGSAINFSQCISQAKTSAATLTFSERFQEAFKTRVRAGSNSLYAGQINNPVQNIPGQAYDSESGFVLPINSTQTAGLADFGTRLKATFNNIPAGTRIFVSTANVYNDASPAPVPNPAGGNLGNSTAAASYTGYAQLVNGETTNDGNAAVGGVFPAVPATDTGPLNGTVPIAELSVSNGSATAVWEVVNTDPTRAESFKFAVYVSYSANAGQNPPPTGSTTVTLSFAATAASGAPGDDTVAIPRFAATPPPVDAFSIQPCNACGSLINPYNITDLSPVATSGSTVVSAAAGCAWTAVSNTPWLTVTQGAGGSGAGTVQFSALTNNTGVARSGSLTIAGQTLTITQRGPGLRIGNAASNAANFLPSLAFTPETTVSPGEFIQLRAPASFGTAAGASASNTVPGNFLPTELAGTRVLFDGIPAPLLYAYDTVATGVVPQAVSGRATTRIEVEFNGSTVDFGTFAVASATPGLNLSGSKQLRNVSGLVITVSPGMRVTTFLTGAGLTIPADTDGRIYGTNETLPVVSLPVTVSVGGVSAQVLSATIAPVPLVAPGRYYGITFIVPPTAPAGALSFSVGVGSVATVAGVTINISNAPCSFALAQNAHVATAGGGADSVNLTTASGCYWTASSNTSWITLNSANAGDSSSAISFTVSASSSSQPRSGTLTVAGMTFTVNQAAANVVPCATAPARVWYNSVDYFSNPNSATDILLVGTMRPDQFALLNSVALPTAPNQRFCTPMPIAPGYLADAYVPTAAERAGDFSPFAGLLFDPASAHLVNGSPVLDPFPGGIIPPNRLPSPLPWRLASYTTCTAGATLSADLSTFPAVGDTRTIQVSAVNQNCPWAVTSDASWIIFFQGSVEIGLGQGGNFSCRVEPNTTYNSRSATISLEGRTYTITQDGRSPFISKTHIGEFSPGQSGVYTVTVSNPAGAAPTSGTVTVTENPPSGMVVVSMNGTGWTCSNSTCTRADSLAGGANYPMITVTVNVPDAYFSPRFNTVSLSGGALPNATATDIAPLNCSNPIQLSGNGAYSSSGGSGVMTLLAPNICIWGANTTASWIHITSTPVGSGNGTIAYTVDANSTGAQRSATITVYLKTFTIIQGANVPISGAGLRFVPVTPCRIADTRNANGPLGGPNLAAATARDFNIQAGPCGIPANAQAYSLNLTVAPLGALGFLSAWPAGQLQPVVSTLNSLDGRIKANAAIVPAGTNGAITLFGSHPTNVIIDINGYFVPAVGNDHLAFYPLPPCRIADTRIGAGTLAGPALAAGIGRTFPLLSSACGIPASAQAYALNMTAIPSGTLGFLNAWPAGSPQPGSSTLNAPTGAITANAAIVPAGANGGINLIATHPTDVIIDIYGYFAPPGSPGGLQFYAAAPCRILDTRDAAGPLGGPQLAVSARRDFVVAASGCGIPATAGAYSLNATAVPPAPLGFLSLWGSGVQPGVSTLNDLDGTIVSNAALVPASATGSVSAIATHATHLILDINGYFGQ